MNWNEHYKLKDCHALFSPSKYHWINYDDNKVFQTFISSKKAEEGTKLHKLASDCINAGRKQAGDDMFALFVNDAIGFKMRSEQVLYFSEYFFGTADAISFYNNILRIHDFKSGVTPTHMEQLMVYAALFCLEYGYSPVNIKIELRIYQDNEANEVPCIIPDPQQILDIMKQIIHMNEILTDLNKEV